MNTKLVIAAVLTAAALTGIFSTNPMAAYADGDNDGDSSETETEQKNKQSGVASGEGEVDNCANNSIDSLDVQICSDAEVDINI